MKTFMSMMVGIFAVSTMSVQAAQYKFVATDDSFETQLCVAVTHNDVAKLTELLKSRGERLRSVQNLVRCNQMPIADVALEYGFSEVAQYLGAEKNEPVLAVLGQ